MMKSIRLRTTLYFIGLIAIIAVIFILGMNHFINSYYYAKKIEVMDSVVADLNKVYEDSRSTDETMAKIDYVGYHFEGKVTIYDKDTNLIQYANKRYQYTRGEIIKEVKYKQNIGYIYETSYPEEGTRWLIYIKKLENGNLALLQIPIIAIEEAIEVVRTFFYYLLLVGVVVAIGFAFLLSNNFSRPIKNLKRVATSIEKLEFDIRYIGNRKDEIGELGNKLNQISDELKKTIQELHGELEKEKNIDKMRRRFVAQVSHELQTPISIISSYIGALSDGIVEPEEIDSYYLIIDDESTKMSRMIKDLLQLSQLEANTMHFNLELFDLSELLDKIIEKYRFLAINQGLQYDAERAVLPQECWFYGDGLRIEQGITNVFGNAIKNCSEQIKVTIEQAAEKLILAIENSGEQISQDDLKHIFESFYKGKHSGSKEGTGLGLAIASKIFNKHHMEYHIGNTATGVKFEIIFPKRMEKK